MSSAKLIIFMNNLFRSLTLSKNRSEPNMNPREAPQSVCIDSDSTY